MEGIVPLSVLAGSAAAITQEIASGSSAIRKLSTRSINGSKGLDGPGCK
jgi:hypothetical protein